MRLDEIRQDIENHPSNRSMKAKGYAPVYAASAQSRIVIIGQAPGRKAQASGIPWDDTSGDTLRNWLGVSREDYYNTANFALVPMDFYFPGKGAHGDLPPRTDFAPRWHPKIFAKMPNVQLTLLVGQHAQKYYLQKRMKRNLTETVKNYQQYLPDFLPLVHPSPLNIRWRSKNPWFEQEVVPAAEARVSRILHG